MGCHPTETRAWTTSTHARAEGPAGGHPLDAGVLVAVGPDGVEGPHTPVRTLGVDPLWQYLVPFSGGRLQVTQTAWDPAAAEWFDVFADDRGPGEWGHWTGGAMTWNSQCAACHSTQVRKGYDPVTDTYATEASEHRVGCAACHGDAAAHVSGGPGPVVPADRWLDVCASCHARRAELTGSFVPGEAFLDHFAPAWVDLSDTFHPDGQVQAEDFEYTSFLQSTMHARGIACVDCHDPHSGDLVRPGDGLCLGCHEALPAFALHDPHSESVGCVGCHMPVTVYMQRDPRHDHAFVIPDPGIDGVPDVCTRCHTDRDAAWAATTSAQWWGPPSGDRRRRAAGVSGARRGDVAVVPDLVAGLIPGSPVGWRTTSASVLEAFVGRPDPVGSQARAALVDALSDDAAIVRFAAIGALAGATPDPAVAAGLDAALTDPVCAVRVGAQRALAARYAPDDPAVADYRQYLRHNADQPLALQEWGAWLLARDRPAEAVQALTQAVAFDGGSALLRDALAVALSVYGSPAEAVRQLQAAVDLAPDDGELWYRLALARVGGADLSGAAEALDQAVTLDPDHVRAWYNLGLIRGRLQDGAAATRALRRAVVLAPADPEIRYGLASTLWSQGDLAGAQEQARIILDDVPGHEGAQAILAQ